MPRWNLAWLIGIFSIALFGFAVSRSAPPRDRDQDYELVRLVVDVLDEVDHKYVRPLDHEAKRKLVEDMVNGGLERLDPHSNFISAKDYKRFLINSTGKFGGVGIQLQAEQLSGGQLMVSSPMVDTPAYDAGILAGDIIVKIDGKSTENMRQAEAVDLITGEPGSKIVLTVLHDGDEEPTDVELKRAEIKVPSVLGDTRKPGQPQEWEYLIDPQDRIGYVRLTNFGENTAAELHTVLENLQKEGARGLILDLRANPGGLLHSAVDICRMFLTEGRIVSTKGRNQQEEVFDAKPGTAIWQPAKDYPVAVLVNRLSASASEIVAAALQDHGRAVIVGERSYGKGSVQNVIEMEGHTSALKLTTASYWRPSGKNIHRFPDMKETAEWGVKPDPGFEVKLNNAERLEYYKWRHDRDVVHGKEGARQIKRKKDKEADKDAKPFVDQTLNKALDYVRGEVKKSMAGTP